MVSFLDHYPVANASISATSMFPDDSLTTRVGGQEEWASPKSSTCWRGLRSVSFIILFSDEGYQNQKCPP